MYFIWRKKICYAGTEIFGSDLRLRDNLVICTYGFLSEENKEIISEKELNNNNVQFVNVTEKDRFMNIENSIYSIHSERFLTFIVLNGECIYLYGFEPYLECHDVLYVWFFYKWIRVSQKLSAVS